MNILLVEDDPQLAMVVTDMLHAHNYGVQVVCEGSAVPRPIDAQFDSVILDIILPDLDGYQVCHNLRRQGFSGAIIMLTAKTELEDRIKGLQCGADDYITKPFEPAELLARLMAVQRRIHTPPDRPIQLRPCRSAVEVNGRLVSLTTREYRLLRYLIHRRGEIVSRSQILRDVWSYHEDTQTRAIDVCIASLRRKIELEPKRPQYIKTIHGEGYRLSVQARIRSIEST